MLWAEDSDADMHRLLPGFWLKTVTPARISGPDWCTRGVPVWFWVPVYEDSDVVYLTCRSNPTSGSSRTCYAPRAAPAFYMHHIYRAPRRLLTCIAFLRFRARMSVLMRTRPVDVGQRFWDFGCMYRVGPCPVMVTVLCIGACLVHTCGFYPHSLSLSELAPYHLLYI